MGRIWQFRCKCGAYRTAEWVDERNVDDRCDICGSRMERMFSLRITDKTMKRANENESRNQ